MERRLWNWRKCGARTSAFALAFVALALVLLTVGTAFAMASVRLVGTSGQRQQPSAVMLILRGIASAEEPRGQLDDESALEYARRVGYRGEVLNVASNGSVEGAQVKMAIDRIRRDEK